MTTVKRLALGIVLTACLGLGAALDGSPNTGLAQTTRPDDAIQPRIRLALESILVQRFRSFGAAAKPGPSESHMLIKLTARSATNVEPIELVQVKVDQADDEAGRSVLRGRQGGFFGLNTTLIAPEDRAGHQFTVDLPRMDAPLLGVRRLGVLAGTATVRLASDIQSVKFIGAAGLRGKTLRHPMLNETLLEVTPSDPPQEFEVQISGGRTASITGVRLTTTAGATIEPLRWGFAAKGNVLTWTLQYDKAPPANAILVIDVADKLTELEVPFRFEQIELP